ncbi:UvrD-helicase domain-containing protein [Mesorhizobium erdmanii]|uniref:UvrD-helicase domain-containing protein n=1 Tax=Mesorhizobium erdmanii TaxID=1777866 RepID=UPI00041DD9AC|nr:UvrD-helicase domain-containing protein [Mesorhizobium erdmanii]
MTIPDLAARRRALTDFSSNILVEAAAGTGKTALMAARVAMMIASGIEPSKIAAITFTEPAASELEARIRWTIGKLRAGKIPPALAKIVTDRLGADELEHLEDAAPRLDEITATTIHGFCQGILRSHGLAAGLDPGSRVVDGTVAEALFDEVLSEWLKGKLTDGADEDGAIATVAKDDPLGVVERIRELAMLRRDHRTATAPSPDLSSRPDLTFADAVAAFSRWHAAGPGETGTADLIDDLELLAAFYKEALANTDFAALWRLTQPPRIGAMRPKSIDLQPYGRTTAWKSVLGAVEGQRRAAEATAQFEQVSAAYRVLIGSIAQRLVHELAALLSEVIEAYDRRKRDAAVLDFDDLLLQARVLVCEHPEIRDWLAGRYPHLLVDEFQDTDPLQAEIVFCIAAATRPARWEEAQLRPGALFLVGDPKQAIYRFRGADIEAYALAKSVIEKSSNGCLLAVTANFRSRSEVIEHVNQVFKEVLAKPGQPGFVPLTATVNPPPLPFPAAAKLTIDVPRDARAEEQREGEAAAVAELCARLIGALTITEADGTDRRLRAGDIALLAPTHTDLWRYERALEGQGIAVASQAGNALFRRQELQDLLALVRILADPLDTLAFGALMRGPLVGLTDEELLDITAALQPDADARRRFQLRTSADDVVHPLARDMLVKLQGLHRLAAELTPMQLLAYAIERLDLRVVMAARHGQRNPRALANLDAIVELARPYGVAGLRAFALDLQRGWQRKRRHPEGRVDVSGDSVEIVTMHSAKGLEWPVVITVNSSTRFKPQDQFVYRQSDDTIHWIVGGIEPPELAAAREEEEFREARQRERLWYVATTRARDLLVIPDLPGASSRSWSRVMDLGQKRLTELQTDSLPAPVASPAHADTNEQTEAVFATEAERIDAASAPIIWDRPSERDPDRSADTIDSFVVDITSDGQRIIGAGALRGNVLHKLMEELLNGELPLAREEVTQRASELLGQLQTLVDDEAEAAGPDPVEMAATALRTLGLPELTPFVSRLVPEIPLWAASPPRFLAGRADAVVMEGDRIALVVDWKSDVNPDAAAQGAHAAQLRDYLVVTGAERGAVVYMSSGHLVWIEPRSP